jgi:predicted transcriptional regulator
MQLRLSNDLKDKLEKLCGKRFQDKTNLIRSLISAEYEKEFGK